MYTTNTYKDMYLPLPRKSSGCWNLVFKMARSYVHLGFLTVLGFPLLGEEMYYYLLYD